MTKNFMVSVQQAQNITLYGLNQFSILLSGSTLMVTCGPFIPASGGRRWESSCSAVQERTVPFELV